MQDSYQVIVVGGGPVGVGLAVDLGRRGISCAVVERRTTLSDIPKGQGLSQRTLEHLASWGVADEVRAARIMPRDMAIGQVTIYGDLRSDHWHAKPSREVVRSFYSQANERLPQYCTEAVLRKRMQGLPTVDAFFGYHASSVEQDASHVRVVIERDGERTTLQGSYLVGCDGGHSLVREQADIARSGTDWNELVALIVFRSRELHTALARYPERSTYRVMHPDLQGYWRFFGRVDADEQFFFHAPVPKGTSRDDFDPRAALHAAAGLDLDIEIDHVGFWDLRVQVADEYRADRIFIAGDAAHTHPPYGGFGLNNGLEDAVNLGWKLTAAIEGWGGERLLNSYSRERQPVFRDVGEEIIGGWIDDDRAFLETFGPDQDREQFEEAFEEMAAGFGKRLARFEPHYEGSDVVFGPAGGVCSALGEHTFTARAGHHLPPQDLSTGRTVFESLGTGFTLIALDAPDAEVARLSDAARSTDVPLNVLRDSYRDGREAYGSKLLLVRPDQFVAWVADVGPTDPTELFRAVTGRG